MSDIDDEMLNDFIEESEELLDSIEEDFLSLETAGNDSELINRLFRAVHTIKGTAGFIGLANIGKLSHSMETLLGFFREGKEKPSKVYIDALLLGSDKLNESDGMDITVENDLLVRLNKQIENGEPPQAQVSVPPLPKPENSSITKSNNNIDNLDKKLVSLFTVQATEVLDSIDGFLENFHKSDMKSSESELKQKCNKIKVIQGSSSYLGLDSISEIAKYLELQLSVLGTDNSKSIENELKILFEIKDKMQLLIDDVYSSDKEDIKDFINKISSNNNLQGNKDLDSAAPVEVVQGNKDVQNKPNTTPKKESLRISVTLIDQLMRLAGELVLIRNQQSLQFREEAIGSRESIQRLDSVTSELQESIMHTRLQPISNVLNKFPRVVRDLGNSLGKDVELIIEGGEVELDKTIVEQLAGPMTHLVRNSIDHGIETPDVRRGNGKSPTGSLTLSAVHEGGIITITIKDDGSGINTEFLKNKVLSKGLLPSTVLEKMSKDELLNLIFLPGFSTNEAVSSVSGRGVGMDVVKTAVEALSGSIKIDSVIGQGTSIILKLPLTLSIIPSLLIRSYKQVFAIPQVNLEILVSLSSEEIAGKIEKAGSEEIYRIQDTLLPLVRLNEILARKNRLSLEDKYEIVKKYHKDDELNSTKTPMVIAVLGAGNSRFGLIVDEVIGAEEIVVNPMHPAIKNINIYSGAAIMGDGSVALILNADGLAFHSNVEFNVDEKSDLFDQDDKEPRESILLFTNSNESERYGVSLSIIKRIVEVEPEEIQNLSEKDYVSIDNNPCRVVRLNEVLDVSPNTDNKRQFLIIFKQIKKPLGLLVSDLRDIADVSIDIENSGYIQNGILGSDVINNKITMFIDINAIFSMAEPKWFEDSSPVISSFDKTKKKIYVVDDSSIFRQMITKYLKEEGYILSVGKNGREAYNALELEDYDMLVSDIEMPEMNGYELIKAVRKGSKNQNITALALSSLKIEEARAPAIALGFDDYQVKLEKKDFVQKVESMLLQEHKI